MLIDYATPIITGNGNASLAEWINKWIMEARNLPKADVLRNIVMPN